MKRIFLIIVLCFNSACAGDLITIQSRHQDKNEIEVIKIYEAPYRDLISIAYDELIKAASMNEFKALGSSYIGYEWKMGNAKCMYRFVPVTGTMAHGTTIVGYFAEFSISGGLPLSSITKIETTAEKITVACSKVDYAITSKLDEAYGSLEINNYSELGNYEGVYWRYNSVRNMVTDEF